MTAKRRFWRALSNLALAAALMIGAAPAVADDVMLKVRNASVPGSSEVQFTESDLLRLPQVTIQTHTDFTDGVVTFVGPLARQVVGAVPAGSATIAHLVAANDYSHDIPFSDFTDYDVILALEADGKRLSLRDKGPIWVMYPIDQHPELKDPVYNPRRVWQLTEIELR